MSATVIILPTVRAERQNESYAELFSRAGRPGWDTWGDQAGHFDPVVCLGARASKHAVAA